MRRSATKVYYQINRDFGADAFACGRVTMEGSFTDGWQIKDVKIMNHDVAWKRYRKYRE